MNIKLYEDIGDWVNHKIYDATPVKIHQRYLKQFVVAEGVATYEEIDQFFSFLAKQVRGKDSICKYLRKNTGYSRGVVKKADGKFLNYVRNPQPNLDEKELIISFHLNIFTLFKIDQLIIDKYPDT